MNKFQPSFSVCYKMAATATKYSNNTRTCPLRLFREPGVLIATYDIYLVFNIIHGVILTEVEKV